MSSIPTHVREWHDSLLRIATEKIEVAYLRAVKDRLPNPAVLVLDLDDPTALAIARASGRHRDTRRFRGQARRAGGAPIAVWHMPVSVAANLLPPDQQRARAILRDWDRHGRPDSFPVVIVGAGATGLVAMPAAHLQAAGA